MVIREERLAEERGGVGKKLQTSRESKQDGDEERNERGAGAEA